MSANIVQISTVVIFDLDDTLVSAKCRVPRQTYHMLNRFRKRGYHIGIISFNPMLPFICATTGLGKYAMALAQGDIDRDELFFQCLARILGEEQAKECREETNGKSEGEEKDGEKEKLLRIFYCDDREDNLQKVKQRFPRVTIWHCRDVKQLFRVKLAIWDIPT